MDIVAIPRNYDTSDSAWLCDSSPDEVHLKKGVSRRRNLESTQAAKVVDPTNIKIRAFELETEHKGNNNIRTNQEQDHMEFSSVGLRTTRDITSPKEARGIVHWLKDDEMLRKIFKSGRILILRLTNIHPQQSLSIDDAANNLLSLLRDARKSCRKRPIVFVGHNSGIVVIERALILASKDVPATAQIFSSTAGIVYLSTPGPKIKAEIEEGWNYFGATTRMALDGENFPYKEANISGFIQRHLNEFRATLAEAEETVLKEAKATESHQVNAGPSAISLNRYQLLDNIVNTDDVVYLKIVNAIASSLECFQLLSAASKGNVDSLRSLLECGIGVNLQDRNRSTALHLAAIIGHTETVKLLLLEYKANVTLTDSKGRSALFLAVDSGKNNVDIVDLLLKKGARARDRDKAGRSPLMLSRQPRIDRKIERMLSEPPFVEGLMDNPTTESWRKPNAPDSATAREACKSFRAVVAGFFQFDGKERFVLEDPSIYHLLYKSSPERVLKNAWGSATGADSIDQAKMEKDLRFRWYHVPANNVGGRFA